MLESKIRLLDIDDLPSVAAIHLSAFPGRALSMLGYEAVLRYYKWQLCGPHRSLCLGIFQENYLLGYCFGGVFSGALSGFLRKNKKFLVLRVLLNPWLVLSPFFRERLSLAFNVFRRTPVSTSANMTPSSTRSFGILSIAVKPESQGLGLGKLLMQEAERFACQGGFESMHLTVEIDNEKAVIFYEGLGWQKALVDHSSWGGLMFKKLSC